MTTNLTAPVSESNQGRRGRPFSMRLSEEERAELNKRAAEARPHMPYEYGNGRLHGSVAHFLIWAARQWVAPEVAKSVAPVVSPRFRVRGGTTKRRPAKRPAKRARPAKRGKTKKGGRR